MWAVVAGSRVERGNAQMVQMVDAVSGFFRVSNGTNIYSQIPVLRYLAPELTGINAIAKYVNLIRGYIEVYTVSLPTLTMRQQFAFESRPLESRRRTRADFERREKRLPRRLLEQNAQRAG